jgi:virginiamycin B lyase
LELTMKAIAILLLCATAAVAGDAPPVTVYPTGDCKASVLTAGTDGGVWFVCSDGSAVLGHLALSGALTHVVMPVTPFAGDRPLATAPDGGVWFTDHEGGVYNVTLEGDARKIATVSPSSSVAVGSDGNLWLASTDTNQIARVRPDDGTVTYFDLALHGAPLSIVAGPDGALWFSANLQSTSTALPPVLGRITTSGELSYVWLATDGIASITSANGRLYLASARGGVAVTPPQTVAAAFVPRALTTGPDGKLWMSDSQGFAVVGGVQYDRALGPNFERSSIVSSGNALWFSESYTFPYCPVTWWSMNCVPEERPSQPYRIVRVPFSPPRGRSARH